MLDIGSLVDGKYKILNIIGQGGMSVVYLAMNEKANKQWAIKEVKKDGVYNFEIVKQGLIAEIDMLKRLKHPNLPSIVDVIEDDGRLLIVMDYIEGNPLSKKIAAEGAQKQEDVLDWAKQLCDVLGYLHSCNPPIIYRDMKPSNIMLKPDGKLVLIDFGTAREYKTNSNADTTCLGTKGYAAPEQFGGRGQTDARTDIYCLGATLYHLVTGRNPGEPPYEMYPIRKWDPTLSGGLESILLKCTQQDPLERYQNCEELAYAFEHYSELDSIYRKKVVRRLVTFASVFFLMMIAIVMSFVFNTMKNNVLYSNYDGFIDNAKLSADMSEKEQYYRYAIRISPDRGEAYQGLLHEVYLEDDNLSAEEDTALRSILNSEAAKGSTNRDLLSTDISAYDEFAYEYGIAYFYSYEGIGDKKNAQGWLDIAAKSETIDAKKKERAIRLGEISKYYAKIGIENMSGDEGITYGDYWRDVSELSKGNLVAIDNKVTALMMYREVAGLVYAHSTDLKATGVSKNEIANKLSDIEAHMESDIVIVNENNEVRIKELKEEVYIAIENAKQALNVAFSE